MGSPFVPGQRANSPEPPRLSIVVLPFRNLSGDPSQDYFADAITEDLTSGLSRLAESFVISRNTAFTFKGKAVDIRQIGRELGVRYVLEGSARRAGRTVGVSVQLIDASTGAHPWLSKSTSIKARWRPSRTTSASRTDWQGCSVSSSSTSRVAGRNASTQMRWTSPCAAGPSSTEGRTRKMCRGLLRCSRMPFDSIPRTVRPESDSPRPDPHPVTATRSGGRGGRVRASLAPVPPGIAAEQPVELRSARPEERI
jgi:TolB-like protein